MALTYVKASGIDITGNYTVNSIDASANVTAGNVKTDNILYANGTAWSFGGTYSNTNVANYLPTYTGNLVALTGPVTTTANVTANYFIGDGSQLTGLPASYSNTNVASYLPTYTGNVSANYFIGNGSTLTYITGANVTGYVPNASNANTATTAGTVTTASQPNITSVGTLSSLTVSGLITATGTGIKTANVQDSSGTITITTGYGNVSGDVGVYGNITVGTSGTGNVTATYFIGNGSQLTGLPASYSNTNVAAYLPTYTGNVSANYFIGNGSTLTYITGANVTGYVPNANEANTAATVTTNAQPNITSVGTLTSLLVSGDATVSGNLTISGTTEYVNVTNLYVKDPIIEMGGGANNTPLSSNDGKDRGALLHYYTTGTVDAFMGWDNSNSEFGFGSNVSVSSEVVTWNSYGNIRASYYLGNGSQLTGMYSNTNVSNYLPTYTGNITANYFIGNGSTLTNITGSNVTGYVPLATAANTADTVTTNAQPNITSVGTLSSLTVTGNSSAGNIKTDNLLYSNGTAWSFSGTYSNTNVANYLPTYTGNLSPANLVVSNSANLGNVGNVYIGGGTANYVLSTNGSGSLSWVAQSGGSSTSTVISVDNFTGNGVANSYTLSVTPTSINSVFVNYNGAFVGRASYSLSGANITFGSTPANGSLIEVTTIEGLTIGSGSFTTRTATGDGTTANYTVSSGATVSSVLATLDGILQTPTTDYTISGTTLTFTSAPGNSVAIQIRELSVASSSSSGASNTSIRAQAMTMGIIFGG